APAAPAAPAAPTKELPAEELLQYEPLTLSNETLALQIAPGEGAITAITLKNYLNADRSAPVKLDQIASAATSKQLQKGMTGIFPAKSQWKLTGIAKPVFTQDSCTITRHFLTAAGQPFQLRQTWQLGSGNDLTMKAEFLNPAAAPLTLQRVVVSDGELQLWATASGDQMRIDSMKLDCYTADGDLTDVAADAKDSKFYRTVGDLRWLALSNKYFISLLACDQPFQLYPERILVPGKDEEYIVTAGAEFPAITLPANGSAELNFNVYAGPKIASLLRNAAPGAERTMHLAWGPLDYLARVLLWALDALKSICGSYGWSIVILTVIIRLLFWPLTAKANASMKKMSVVQPKIQELRQKYKDNPQMLNTKTMELYREEGINPLGGCLPILLQIPVFFALYATLDGAVELRQVSFLWAKDLAAPDTVCHLPGFLFSLPVNPLVLAMTLLMVLQQKLTPSAMDPMQQKMMMLMPVVMLFVLYNLPSGLTLYWTVSQVFSILQLVLQKRNTAPAAAGKGIQKA
ncbi:MAG: membrane protein insertase YidC, partial [Lentisphaeria bacterium]|nr:membrane protein insertase YidC [Lentisphaeria bacterium]